ncbi:HAMP domain-containing histidine kinase [Candidatus Roizmanbacteria bacterium]|nr:HAMP domain-containing histidine kinase [Candidatus Roizmanbacteria bacterium]
MDKVYEYSKQYIPSRFFKRIGLNFSFFQFSLLFRVYLFPILTSALVIYMAYLLPPYQNRVPYYLTYFVLIVVYSWLAGAKAGLVGLLVIFIGNSLVWNQRDFVESAFFVFGAILISHIIDHTRRTKEIRKLMRQEKIYAQFYTELYDKYNKSLEDIKSRDEFLSIASHELKTPLTSMLLKLSQMLNKIKNVSFSRFSVTELMRVLENAQGQINWLTAMINDLLNVSLMTTGKMNLEKEKTDLTKIAKFVIENFSEVIKREGYQVKIEIKAPVVGYWDKRKIEQAVTNLLSNAIKYGNKKPIDIQVFNHNSTAKFIIRDRGIGISREDRKIIFKPFQRPKSVENYKKGLGVGLYLTHQIIRAHGGDIKVSSQPMSGTTFVLELPLKT